MRLPWTALRPCLHGALWLNRWRSGQAKFTGRSERNGSGGSVIRAEFGFHAVTVANNHNMDFGAGGLTRFQARLRDDEYQHRIELHWAARLAARKLLDFDRTPPSGEILRSHPGSGFVRNLAAVLQDAGDPTLRWLGGRPAQPEPRRPADAGYWRCLPSYLTPNLLGLIP